MQECHCNWPHVCTFKDSKRYIKYNVVSMHKLTTWNLVRYKLFQLGTFQILFLKSHIPSSQEGCCSSVFPKVGITYDCTSCPSHCANCTYPRAMYVCLHEDGKATYSFRYGFSWSRHGFLVRGTNNCNSRKMIFPWYCNYQLWLSVLSLISLGIRRMSQRSLLSWKPSKPSVDITARWVILLQ